MKPQSNKIDSILTWPQPQNKKQVRTFLVLVGYYRPFIPRFATKAAPFTELTRKCHPNQVRWTKEAEQAFTDLKQALCCEPILQAPNFNEPFVLQTDLGGRSWDRAIPDKKMVWNTQSCLLAVSYFLMRKTM